VVNHFVEKSRKCSARTADANPTTVVYNSTIKLPKFPLVTVEEIRKVIAKVLPVDITCLLNELSTSSPRCYVQHVTDDEKNSSKTN